jgi:hypothetical protein
LPRSYAELVERRKALVEWAELTGGFLGRSPDHVASSVSGMMMGIEVFDRHDPKRAERPSATGTNTPAASDLFLTYVINNVQGDRSKAFGDQGERAGHGRAHRRRGCVGHHHPRRQTVRHLGHHGQRDLRRLRPAAASPARRIWPSPARCR